MNGCYSHLGADAVAMQWRLMLLMDANEEPVQATGKTKLIA
jgi:hypothetical protein